MNYRKAEVERLAKEAGLTIRTHSPGDGVTRYKFFRLPVNPDQCYFGPENGIATCLGIAEASAWVDGYHTANYHARSIR